MHAFSASQHPAAECLKEIVETARQLAPTPKVKDLNTIEEHESYVASPQDIKASSPFAQQYFFEAIGSISAHRQAVNADPTKRCSIAKMLQAQKLGYSNSDSSKDRVSDSTNQLGVCRPLLPAQQIRIAALEAISPLMVIL